MKSYGASTVALLPSWPGEILGTNLVLTFYFRIDGERALAALSGKQIEGHEMRMGWGNRSKLNSGFVLHSFSEWGFEVLK